MKISAGTPDYPLKMVTLLLFREKLGQCNMQFLQEVPKKDILSHIDTIQILPAPYGKHGDRM